MGKSRIKSYGQISHHSRNRFKLFGQTSNPIFSSNLKSSSDKSQIFNFRFKLDTFVYYFFTTSETTCSVGQWSQSVAAIQLVCHSRIELHAVCKARATLLHILCCDIATRPSPNLNYSQPPPPPCAQTRNCQSVSLGFTNQITAHCRVNCRPQGDQGLAGSSSLIQVAAWV